MSAPVMLRTWCLRACDNFLYSFKGAPSARRADRPEACSQRMRDMHEEALNELGGASRRGGEGVAGDSPQVAGQPGPLPPARKRTGAGRCPRADAPPLPRRAPHRNGPSMCHGASWPNRSSCARRTSRRAKGPQAQDPERRTLSGLAPPASRAPEDRFRPLRRNDLRDPPLSAGDLCQPSGPDGKGQAEGQARRRAANLGRSKRAGICNSA
jgi:hypothetical protein